MAKFQRWKINLDQSFFLISQRYISETEKKTTNFRKRTKNEQEKDSII